MSDLAACISASGARVVGLDGAPYAGKSYLADSLRERLGATILRTNDYVPDGAAGRYFDFVDADLLQSDLDNARQTHRVVVIEGTCLRAVLDRVGVSPDFVVYVRRTDGEGDFTNSDISEAEYADIAAEEDAIGKYVEGDDGQSLSKDNSWYHMRYKPVATADEVYEWSEDVAAGES